MLPVRQRMKVVEGDITTLKVDAIVNAANDRLERGGGVCATIFVAADPRLDAACAALGGCPTGDARITPGFDLPARWIIHAAGPVRHGGDRGEPEQLAGCCRGSLELAAGQGSHAVAFPAISTGIYGYPAVRATDVAVGAVAGFLRGSGLPERVPLCCFGAASAQLHRGAVARLAG